MGVGQVMTMADTGLTRLAEEVQQRRFDAHLEPVELARRAGLSRQRVYEIESGRSKKQPSVKTLWAIAMGLARSEDGSIDRVAAKRHYDAFLVALGTIRQPTSDFSPDNESSLRALLERIHPPEQAEFWAAFHAAVAKESPAALVQLEAMVRAWLDTRPGAG